MSPNSDIILVFIGESGSGKSTCINYFANYFAGTGFSQQSGYSQIKVVIPNRLFPQAINGYSHSERNVHDNTTSQTTRCTEYDFTWKAHNNMRVTVVDTPGFNDTNQNRDDANIQEILKAFGKLPFVSAVFITINGTVSRLSTSIRSTLSQLRGSLPDSIFANLFFIFTNCTEESRSFDIRLIEEYNPVRERTFHMQNSLFSAASIADVEQDPKKRRRAETSWQESAETIEEILTEVGRTAAASTQVFNDMRIKREQLLANKANLLAKQKSLLEIINALKIEKQRLSAAENDRDANANYQANKTIEVIEIEKKSYHSTICTEHGQVSVCHEKCGLDYEGQLNYEHFRRCAAADSTGQNCKHCKCGMNQHHHTYEIPVARQKTVQEIIQAKKAAFDLASQHINTAQTEVQKLDNTCQTMTNEVNECKNGIMQSIRDLKSICSHFNFSEEMATTIQTLRQEAKIAQDLNAKKEFNDTADAIEALLRQLA